MCERVKKKRKRGMSLRAKIVTAFVVMALVSVPVNFFISYPVYATMYGGMDAILAAYREINPGMGSLLACLLVFNMPFTLVKGLVDSVLCFLIYKPLSPILHGRQARAARGV